MTPLFPYQEDAIREILLSTASYLAFEQGLGKTRVSIEVARRMKARRILVICPATVRLVWEQEIAKWWPDHPPIYVIRGVRDIGKFSGEGVFVISYGLISLSKSLDYAAAIRKAGTKDPFALTILDEAQAVKNPGAIRTKAILRTMLPVLGRLLPLSGTPAPNHAGELFTILRVLKPEATFFENTTQPMPLQAFEDRYCTVAVKRFGSRQIRVIEGSRNINDLRSKISGFMIRKTKAQVLKDLPPMRFDTIPVAPKGDVSAYDDIINPSMTDEEVLRALKDANAHVMRLRAALGAAKVDGAVEYLQEWFADNPRQKAVVWAHHSSAIQKLTAGLADLKPAVIVGGTAQKDRAAAVNQFLTDNSCRVFIGNILAAGTGITLVGPTCPCSDAFFVESSFSVGDNFQAASRIHRVGQKDAVLIRSFVAHGTLDDRIQSILVRKAEEFTQLFA